MTNNLWNLYDYPEIRSGVADFVTTVIHWTYPNGVDKEKYKEIFSNVLKWVRFSNNTQKLYELSKSMNKSYNEFMGKTEKEKPFIKEEQPKEEEPEKTYEREVVERAWERFKEYTSISAAKNGKLKQTENPKVWQWLKNNELSNFNCSTDIYSLPMKIKKLIVKAANYNLDGVSVTSDEEAGKKIIELDYLDEVCANCYKLF